MRGTSTDSLGRMELTRRESIISKIINVATFGKEATIALVIILKLRSLLVAALVAGAGEDGQARVLGKARIGFA